MTGSIGADGSACANTVRAGLFAAAAALVLAAFPAAAATLDPVPLPHPRPDRVHAAPRPAAPAAATAREPAMPAISPNSRFSRDQQIALANINAYFNSFRTMQGQFIQFGPSGEQTEGVFFINRPGQMRFHYNPPSKLDIFVNDDSFVVQDNRMMTQDIYPLQKTPFRYLLADRIDLSSQELVDSVTEEPDLISVVIIERSRLVQGELKLMFDRKTYELRQWVITDAQGLQTAVAIYNVSTGKQPDPSLFRFTVRQTKGN